MWADWITAVVTVAVLVAVVAVRSLTGGRIEIRLNDAIIAAIAAVLTLFVFGRISKFGVGSEGVTVETAKQAILSASAQPIDRQVALLPVAPVEEALKGGVGLIPSMVHREVQGLDFLLGGGGYDPHAVQEYLETLTRYPFFRFVTLLDPNGSLFGMIDARKLLARLQDPASGQTFASFASEINRASADDRTKLAALPGFVPAGNAVTRGSDKRDVLEKMEKLGADWLPVLKPGGQLDGIVDRSRLTASLILDVTNQLKTGVVGQP